MGAFGLSPPIFLNAMGAFGLIFAHKLASNATHLSSFFRFQQWGRLDSSIKNSFINTFSAKYIRQVCARGACFNYVEREEKECVCIYTLIMWRKKRERACIYVLIMWRERRKSACVYTR